MNRITFQIASAGALIAVALGAGCKNGSSSTTSVSPVKESTPYSYTEPVSDTGVEVGVVTPTDIDSEIEVVVEPEGIRHIDDSDVDHISVARGELTNGKTETAIEQLEMAIFDNPDSFEAFYLLGQAFQSQGDVEQAAWAFREASVLRPEDLDVLALRAQLLLEIDPVEAENVTQTMIQLSPGNPEGYRLLARSYSKRNMWSETIAANLKAIDLGDESPYTFNNKGYAELVLGQYEDAIDTLSRAVALEGATHFMWNNLGLAYEKSGRLQEAFTAYNHALEVKEGYVNAKVNLGRLTTVAEAQGIVLGDRMAATDTSSDLPDISEEISPELGEDDGDVQ